MVFDYIKRESDFGIIYWPTLPISLNGFPIGNALIDTGADVTLLPMEINQQVLHLELDVENAIDFTSAGGGRFKAIPPFERISFSLEHSGFRPMKWKGTAFFVPRQPMVLLGQHQCLEQLKITLDGKHRKLYVEKTIGGEKAGRRNKSKATLKRP